MSTPLLAELSDQLARYRHVTQLSATEETALAERYAQFQLFCCAAPQTHPHAHSTQIPEGWEVIRELSPMPISMQPRGYEETKDNWNSVTRREVVGPPQIAMAPCLLLGRRTRAVIDDLQALADRALTSAKTYRLDYEKLVEAKSLADAAYQRLQTQLADQEGRLNKVRQQFDDLTVKHDALLRDHDDLCAEVEAVKGHIGRKAWGEIVTALHPPTDGGST